MDCFQVIEYFYPDDDKFRQLLIKHSMSVAQKAVSLAANVPELVLDMQLVENGAMLHDIGIGRCYAPAIFCLGDADYIAHGTIGAEMLREYGQIHQLDMEKYARVAENHTGSGITAVEVAAQKLPIPVRDYLPVSNEEKLITLADKFFSKSGDMQEKTLSQIRKSLAKFGAPCVARWDELTQLFKVQ